jgi:hypothetical protein
MLLALLSQVPGACTPMLNRGHGSGTYSRPSTLNAQSNHTRRMSHTTSTITIIVPTKPKPNIAPPRGYIGHQGYPCGHDRPGFRLSSDQNKTITRIIEIRTVRSPTCCVWITGFHVSHLSTEKHRFSVRALESASLFWSGFVAADVCLPGHLAFPGMPLRANFCAAHLKGPGYRGR